MSYVTAKCRCANVVGDFADYTILHRDSGDKLVSTNVPKICTNHCIERIIAWINIANYSLDISLFFIMHKGIVNALVKRSTRGIRCRLVVFRHWFEGPKAPKHERYLEYMQRKGVQVRWISEDSGPASYFRYFFIDCSEPAGSPEVTHNEGAFVYGDQKTCPPHFDLMRDFCNLRIAKKTTFDHPWCQRFDDVWNARYSQMNDLPVHGGVFYGLQL